MPREVLWSFFNGLDYDLRIFSWRIKPMSRLHTILYFRTWCISLYKATFFTERGERSKSRDNSHCVGVGHLPRRTVSPQRTRSISRFPRFSERARAFSTARQCRRSASSQMLGALFLTTWSSILAQVTEIVIFLLIIIITITTYTLI